MIPNNEDCQRIHAQFCALTGIPTEFTMSARFIWESFLARGYQEPDLACVVRYIKDRIKQKRREKESLMMRNMVQNLDYFAETLSMARAESRNSRTPDARQRVLMDAGLHKEPKTEARPVGDVMAAAKALEDLRKWRIENGL